MAKLPAIGTNQLHITHARTAHAEQTDSSFWIFTMQSATTNSKVYDKLYVSACSVNVFGFIFVLKSHVRGNLQC